MLRRNYKDQFVGINDNRRQLWVLWIIGEHAKLTIVAAHIVGNLAAQRTLDYDSNRRMQALKLRQHAKQVQSCKLVRPDNELSFLQFAELAQRFSCALAQIEQPFRVFPQHMACVSEHSVSSRAIKERLADFGLKLPDCLANGGLRAI